MNFDNGSTYVHWRIMDVMLVFSLNLLVIKMTAIPAYPWMSIEMGELFWF